MRMHESRSTNPERGYVAGSEARADGCAIGY